MLEMNRFDKNGPSNVDRIYSSISGLVETEKLQLLKMLTDQDVFNKRKNLRSAYFMPIDYTDGSRKFSDFISDVSRDGLFIKTQNKFNIEQELCLSVLFPDHQQRRIVGNVSRRSDQGIGVKFKEEIFMI